LAKNHTNNRIRFYNYLKESCIKMTLPVNW
jgi:hypothetical protein